MENDNFKCSNCESPIPSDIAEKNKFNICPVCGSLYPQTIIYIENYFRIIQLSQSLKKAKNLLLKSELDASVREAIIEFETIVREKSGLTEDMGTSLMGNAFNFKYDSKKQNIIENPKIKLNKLSNVSERNEQEGIKLMTMGFMQGIRNIYMHTRGANRLYYALQIITIVDLFLKQVFGDSIVFCSGPKPSH